LNKYILSADELCVGYGKKTVVDNISLDIKRGRTVCLIGPNGAGKSTILHTFAGLINPLHGNIKLNGKDIKKIKRSEIAKKISLVLSSSEMPSLTTVYELVSLGRAPYTGYFGKLSEKDHEIVNEALLRVGAYDLRERFCSELSDGEKQKVMIARAIVQQPELLILDEPTSHLDISHKIEVMRILTALTVENGLTVLMSLHDVDLALKYCDDIITVKNGEITAYGPPESVIRNGDINKLFDVSNAEFSEQLGSLEIKGPQTADIFIVGCGDSVYSLARTLTRNEIGVSSGIMYETDIDAVICATLCSYVVTAPSYTEFTSEILSSAKKEVENCTVVIDSGFVRNDVTKYNSILLDYAAKMNKPVLSVSAFKTNDAILQNILTLLRRENK
jgi:iron complex transport system ATP-binding protein